MLPIGLIAYFGTLTPPANWVLANGQALSRSTYSDLFALYGTTYGSGDGTTTFNVPNLGGRVVVAPGTAPFNTGLGSTLGEVEHTLTSAEAPVLSLDVADDWATPGSAKAAGCSDGTTSNQLTDVVNDQNGGQPHNNIQPSIILSAVIFAGV